MDAEGVLDEWYAEDMVEVKMCAEQILYLQSLVVYERDERLLFLIPIEAWVDDGGIARELVVQYVAVLMEHIADECLYFHIVAC